MADPSTLITAQLALPFLTAELAGTGGVAKATPEDFEVEEIPAYEPSGEGEHLFLWLEKRNLDAAGLLRHVARALDLDEYEIGCAGLKDARAVTRQYLSVPAARESLVSQIESPEVHVLSARRHGNKLKTGHLRGNRFRISIREPGAEALPRARAIAAELGSRGVPNYFGPQRFGRGGETLRLGLELLTSSRPPRRSGRLLRLALSSVQSALFNVQLAERLQAGQLTTVRQGEVLQVVASGGPFIVDDPAREQERVGRREVVPAGPMFGPKMRAAKGEPAAAEEALLARYGLSLAAFERYGKLLRGTRRAMVIWPGELTVSESAGGYELRTSLPKGSYATVVVRELVKTETPHLAEAEAADEE
jgi:tRNA pseudouridine13 synthase